MSLGDQSASPAPLLYCICKREKVLTILLLPFPPTHTGVYLPVWPCSFCTISLVCKFQMYTMLSSDPDTIHWKINKTSSVRSQCQTKAISATQSNRAVVGNTSRPVPHRATGLLWEIQADQCHTEQQDYCGKYRQTSATQSNRTIVGNTGRPVPHRATVLLWEIQTDQYHPKQQDCGKYKLTCTTNSNMACCGKCKQISTTESNSSVVGNISRPVLHRATGLVGNISRPVLHRATGLVGNISRPVPHRATGLVGNISRPVPHRATGLVGNISRPVPHRATGLVGNISRPVPPKATGLVGNISRPVPHRATGLLWEIHTDQDHTKQ